MTVGINKLVQMFYPRAHWRAARSPEFSPRARPRAIRLCGAAAASVRIGRVDDSSGVARGAYRMLIRCSSALRPPIRRRPAARTTCCVADLVRPSGSAVAGSFFRSSAANENPGPPSNDSTPPRGRGAALRRLRFRASRHSLHHSDKR